MMANYQAVFKCMICGELWLLNNDHLNITEQQAEEQIGKVIRIHQQFGSRPDLQGVPFYIPHRCKDGSCGVSQFAGLKRR